MVLVNNPLKVQQQLAENARMRRLQMELTQEGLAERSGVPLSRLRKFEQKGAISLESYLKIQMVLGGLEAILQASQVNEPRFSSIDDVLDNSVAPARKRGWRK